jgi:hypothetical protein
LCTAQGGDATTTKKELRKIASGTQQFILGGFALKGQVAIRPGLFSNVSYAMDATVRGESASGRSLPNRIFFITLDKWS